MIQGKLSPVVTKLVKSSIFCKCLYAVLLIGYCISFSDTLFHGLAITPQLLLPPNFWLWTVFTYFLVERNVIILVADFLCVHLCGIVLEPLWTPIELLTYLLIVNCCVALSSTVFLFILYLLTEHTELFFASTIHGLPGFVGAMLVAVKQIVPDSTLLATPAGRLRNSHLPALVFLANLLLCVFAAVRWVSLYMVLNGAFFGWIWLRYYQPHQNGTRGDMSEHFSFASFFPSAIQGPIETVSGVIYRLFLQLGVCKPAIRHFDVSQLQSVSVQLPGMEPIDAERRRQKALRDLTERLNKAKDQTPTAWPQFDPEHGVPSSVVVAAKKGTPEPPGTHGKAGPIPVVDPQGKEGHVETMESSELHDYEDSITENAEEAEKPKLVLNTSGSEPDLDGIGSTK